MSASLHSFMVDMPVQKKKPSRLRRTAAVTVIGFIIVAAIVTIIAVAGLKFLLLHAGALLGRV